MAVAIPEFKNFSLSKGYVIYDGLPVKKGSVLAPDDILFCEEYCVIIDAEKEIRIDFSGFGRFRYLVNFQKVVEEPASKTKVKKQPEPEDSKEPKRREKIQKVVFEELESDLFPRPKNGTIVLHTKGGKIAIVPREKCKNACNMQIDSIIKGSYSESFKKGQQPVFYYEFDESDEDSIYWKFSDGEEKRTGQFEVKIRSNTSLKESLSSKKPVEFLN
jgi:hypothetical protein